MNNKELIAEWLDIEIAECPLDFDVAPANEVGMWAVGEEDYVNPPRYKKIKGLENGTFVRVRESTCNDVTIFVVCRDSEDDVVWWEPETDITLWHGPDGLLVEIEERWYGLDFFDTLEDIIKARVTTACSATAVMWKVLRATPAQLSEALVKMIKEEQ